MRGSTAATLLISLGVVMTLAYFFYNNPEFSEFVKEFVPFLVNQTEVSLIGGGFYPSAPINETSYPLLFKNPRWNHMPIKFYLDVGSADGLRDFGEDDLRDVRTALGIWQEKTNGFVSFREVYTKSEAEVVFSWYPSLGDIKGGKVVGEGGPSKAVDTGLYTLIYEGEVFLVPGDSSCINVNRAVHEFGHVLGLEHSTNPEDIMYTKEISCGQTLTSVTANVVKNFYQSTPKADLVLFNVSAVKRGKLMDMTFVVKNQGILDAPDTQTSLVIDNQVVNSFHMPSVKPGESITTRLQNIRVPSEFSVAHLNADGDDRVDELYEENNKVSLLPN